MRSFHRHLAGATLVLAFALGSAGGAWAGSAKVERLIMSERSAQPARVTAEQQDGSARDSAWLFPADGVISSGYGPRGRGFHPGIDIGSLRSLTVRAATGGTVVGAGWLAGYSGYGNVVIVDIGDGYTLLYAHLSRSAVAAGDVLQRGDVIGTAGCTGTCYGTHLHFELRKDGRWTDVTPFLRP